MLKGSREDCIMGDAHFKFGLVSAYINNHCSVWWSPLSTSSSASNPLVSVRLYLFELDIHYDFDPSEIAFAPLIGWPRAQETPFRC